MQDLTLHHFPAKGRRRARVRVSYRPQEGAQAQERETAFTFDITEEQRRLIQWYLEEHLLYPWGEFRNRARRVEDLIEQLGAKLLDAVFRNRETYALYAHVADDLANTRMVIHTSDPAGIALPLEHAFYTVYAAYGHQLFRLVQTNTQLAMNLLRAEESNLMYAFRLARQHERWSEIVGILSGLNRLLTMQGRC